MKKILIVSLFFFCSINNALCEETSWSFPNPQEYSAHLTEICKPESTSAIYIARLRDSGITKELASARLPQGTPDRLRLTHVVKENLDDLYQYPNIDIVTYYSFRGASCVREKAEGKPVILFTSIAHDALRCQQEIGLTNRTKLAQCVRALLK